MYCSRCGSDTEAGPRFCTQCGQSLGAAETPAGSNAELSQAGYGLTKLDELRERLYEIEAKLPQSNVINPKFWPRAFTVLGHNLAATAVVYGCIFVIFLFVMVVAVLGGLAGR
jgi:hypothetical protein